MTTEQQVANLLLNQSAPFNQSKVNCLISVVSLLEGSDPTKISYVNSILTQLRQSQSLFSNAISILSTITHNQTILFILMSFQQQLTLHWKGLSDHHKNFFKQYFITLFNGILPEDDSSKATINKKVKTILVKMYILDYSDTDTFIDNLIDSAQTNQFKCENVLDLFLIMADESQTYGSAYFEKKYQPILTLAAMVLKSTQETKVKNTLIKNSMSVLEKFCKTSQSIVFPREILAILVEIFKSNKFRIQICNLFSLVCSQSLDTLLDITKGVLDILDWNCSIQAYRATIKAKQDNQLLYTDLFLRSYTALINKIITAYISFQPPNVDEYLRVCYQIVLALSESEDRDTWTSCRQAWILYVKIGKDLLNLEELSTRIIFKCEMPLELSPQQNSLNLDQEEREEREDNANFSALVYKLSNAFTENMYNRIWEFIESKTFVKFQSSKFISCTYALCYLNQSLSDNNTVTNMLKLLMNISESVEAEYKKVVANQFLSVVSFFPLVIRDNYGLRIVLQDKYLENLEDSIRAFVHYSKNVKISEEGVVKIINKINELGNEELQLQELLWEIIIRTEGNPSDSRLGSQPSLNQYLSIAIRNIAGVKIYQLGWNLRWDMILQMVSTVNGYKQAWLEKNPGDRRNVKKIQEAITNLCEEYCGLCLAKGIKIRQNQLLMRVAESMAKWEGFPKIQAYFH